MSLREREQDIENRYAHDQEMRFRIEARRNKLLGLWAAGQLGKSGEGANAYAQEVIRSAFESPGSDNVFRKIRADFDSAGVQQSDHQIQRHMAELLLEAETQIKQG